MRTYANEYRKFLVERLTFFRAKSGFSARDLSLRIGKSGGYLGKFEMGAINIPSEVLLDAITVLGVSKEKFFCKNPKTFDDDAAMIEKWNHLSDESKKLVLNLMENLK